MKKCLFLIIGIVLGLTTDTTLAPADPGEEKRAKRIDDLIRQLGHDDFEKREEASRDLEKLGEPALRAVRKAAIADKDLEIRRRSHQLILLIMTTCGKSKSIGMELAPIEDGSFEMGSPRGETFRKPDESLHKVRITQAFLMGKYEVTQEAYQKVMKANPSWFSAVGGGREKVTGKDTTKFPVEKVTWFDALEFCNRLSKLDGYDEYYKLTDVKRRDETIESATVAVVGGNGYRLPTEAEWEYTCRAGSRTAFHFGGDNTGKEANLKPGPAIGYGGAPNWPTHNRTTTVGSYAANNWGLYDMHGNSAEWCWDWYDADYYTKSPEDDPTGPAKGEHRVVRSGSWLVNEWSCRSASRYWRAPGDHLEYIGFRVARTP